LTNFESFIEEPWDFCDLCEKLFVTHKVLSNCKILLSLSQFKKISYFSSFSNKKVSEGELLRENRRFAHGFKKLHPFRLMETLHLSAVSREPEA
jgi:hypothetical protein